MQYNGTKFPKFKKVATETLTYVQIHESCLTSYENSKFLSSIHIGIIFCSAGTPFFPLKPYLNHDRVKEVSENTPALRLKRVNCKMNTAVRPEPLPPTNSTQWAQCVHVLRAQCTPCLEF